MIVQSALAAADAAGSPAGTANTEMAGKLRIDQPVIRNGGEVREILGVVLGV